MASKIDIIRTIINPIPQISPNIVELSNVPKKELVNCVNNQVNDTIPMDDSPIGHDQGGKFEVDIVTNTVCDGIDKVVQDETECSSSSLSLSSFGCSNSENGDDENLDDMEVESHFYDDGILGFGGCYDLLKPRKKKVSSHWRDYVRPLMWRCKWVELQIRELQSQASKYDRESAEYDKRKQCELANFSTEEHAAKSSPYVFQNSPEKIMKRKKRRRVEDTVDLASYTASHNVLSYFETKKSGVDAAHVDDDHCHAGNNCSASGEYEVDGEMPPLEFKESDTVRSILRKIEETQIHVRQLRMRMDKVVSENTETFASGNSSLLTRNRLTNCGPNSILPHVNDEPALLGSVPTTCQLSSKKLVMPKTGVSIAEEVTSPDIIKSVDDPHIRQKCEKTENEILIANRPVKEEVDDTQDNQTQVFSASLSEQEVKPKIVHHVPVRPSKTIIPQEQPAVKIRPKKKRKPGWPKGKPRRSNIATG